jgi:hypothetical protein
MKKKYTLLFLSICSLCEVLKGAELLPSIQPPPYENVVVASIMTDQGLYNLNICVNFKSPAIIPGRMSDYTLDTYKAYLEQMEKLWKKRVFNIINKPLIKISELSSLKNEVEKDLVNLILKEKINYKIGRNTNVIFSITHFYLSKI